MSTVTHPTLTQGVCQQSPTPPPAPRCMSTVTRPTPCPKVYVNSHPPHPLPQGVCQQSPTPPLPQGVCQQLPTPPHAPRCMSTVTHPTPCPKVYVNSHPPHPDPRCMSTVTHPTPCPKVYVNSHPPHPLPQGVAYLLRTDSRVWNSPRDFFMSDAILARKSSKLLTSSGSSWCSFSHMALTTSSLHTSQSVSMSHMA